MKFCNGGEKMRNASGHLGENERQWKKSEQEHVRHILHKTCNQEAFGSFTLQSCKTTAKKRTKKVCCTSKVAFLPIRPIFVFHRSLFHRSRCLRRLALHDFKFCLSKLQILSAASLLAQATSTYYTTSQPARRRKNYEQSPNIPHGQQSDAFSRVG